MSFKGLWAISLNSGIYELRVRPIRFTHCYDNASHPALAIRNFTIIAYLLLAVALDYTFDAFLAIVKRGTL